METLLSAEKLMLVLVLLIILSQLTLANQHYKPLKQSERHQLKDRHASRLRIMRHQNKHQENFKFISKLPKLKISNIDNYYLQSAITRLANYKRITSYYNKNNWMEYYIYFVFTFFL
jgi:hypothetical protein